MSTNIKKTYLELSEDNGGSHKFYEIILDDRDVSIKFGRIGQQKPSLTKSFITAELAQAEYNKKIEEKTKKGYAESVEGARTARPVTRRATTSNQSTSKNAPVLWKFKSDSGAFGIFVDDNNCWLGNEKGSVYKLDHDGKVEQQFRFDDGVKAIVSDGHWLYAGCDDGKIYDLTGKLPRVSYAIDKEVDILWIDICDGVLAISDRNGNVFINNYEGELLGSHKSIGSTGWMIRSDENMVYHGHSHGVTAYHNIQGLQPKKQTPSKPAWHCKINGAILFGWQEKSALYAASSDGKIYAVSKNGDLLKTYKCDAPIYSCATSINADYIFAADNHSSIYCFNNAGDRLWKLGSGCGSALSMQYMNDKLYIVTTDGSMACIDASLNGVNNAQAGNVPVSRVIQAPKISDVTNTTDLESTDNSTGCIILQCIKEDSKLRIRVLSDGYHKDWNVQFPNDIRTEGDKYVVNSIKESSSGEFYRILGDIKRWKQ